MGAWSRMLGLLPVGLLRAVLSGLLPALLLAGCAASGPVTPATLTELVPTVGLDRTDMPCYYGVIW